MPPDPVYNPFPGGEKRELFRPLQYARADIEICNVNMHARNVVHMSGMHLEAVCRLVIKEYSVLGTLRFNNTTLGKAVHKLSQLNRFDIKIINALFDFVAVYNRSKHDINQDENRARLFNAMDAVTSYFSARILGLHLLKEIGYPDAITIFKINNKKQECFTYN